MNKTNLALLGFVSSAADYLKDRVGAEGDEIRELTDINFEDLKKELIEEMSTSFSGGNNDAIDAGRKAFARLVKEEKKTPLMSEFDDLFNVDFGNDRKDKEIQNHLLNLLKEPAESSHEYDIIAKASAENDKDETAVRIPADSEKIDNLFSQILDSENRRQAEGSLSEFDDEPEEFEEKLDTEKRIDKELDLRPLSERLRAYAGVNEDFSEEELDRLYKQLDVSEIRREREEQLRENDANKTLSKRLKETKHKDLDKDSEPYVSELPKVDETRVVAKGRYHQTLSDLLREVRDSNGPSAEETQTAELEEEEKTADNGFDSPVFGRNYLQEEENEEVLPHDPIEDLFIMNPASDEVSDEETAELEEPETEELLSEETEEENYEQTEEETEEEADEEIEFPVQEETEEEAETETETEEPAEEEVDYMGELINGLNTDAIAQRIENVRKEEEDAKNAVYESIKGIYPYLSDSFIRGVYDLKGSLGYDYPRSEERRVGKECRSRWSPYH